MPRMPPPGTELELLERARRLAGKTLQQLAGNMALPVPTGQKYAKGWIGELMERCLGASAATLPVPDFREIQVELKTLPINRLGKPRESTYVCTVPLNRESFTTWENSVVRKKLARVLWVPVEAAPDIPLARRRIGNAFIWSPDADEERLLRTDWQELMEMISLGELDCLNACFGEALQIRPKAAHAGARTPVSNAAGESASTLPRGFYLRPAFTYCVLQRYGRI
ncbi:MAG: DNA mismatch repair endonuclease MutH [Gammaproteobacteria bacterium]|nr:MAG: DNA mismatch repair endonuclease MutH [Gammaproteobacteria bacterium]